MTTTTVYEAIETATIEDVNIAIVIGFATPLALAAIGVSAITVYFVIAAKRRRKVTALCLLSHVLSKIV